MFINLTSTSRILPNAYVASRLSNFKVDFNLSRTNLKVVDLDIRRLLHEVVKSYVSQDVRLDTYDVRLDYIGPPSGWSTYDLTRECPTSYIGPSLWLKYVRLDTRGSNVLRWPLFLAEVRTTGQKSNVGLQLFINTCNVLYHAADNSQK